jgi:hypothetical protein
LAEERPIDGPVMTIRLYGPPSGRLKLTIRGTEATADVILPDDAGLPGDEALRELRQHIQLLLDLI